MAKVSAPGKRQYKTDLNNLSQKDVDILSMETKDVMKKHKMEKQGVYDRRFALNKKIKQAGLTVEQVLSKGGQTDAVPNKAPLKKTRSKKSAAEKPEATEESRTSNRELMVVDKQIPVIMKPIEINFDNFSIKLNGVPKNISINPDTRAIEIEL